MSIRLFKTRDLSYWIVVQDDDVFGWEHGPFDSVDQATDYARTLNYA
jgi:hypothetical protein